MFYFYCNGLLQLLRIVIQKSIHIKVCLLQRCTSFIRKVYKITHTLNEAIPMSKMFSLPLLITCTFYVGLLEINYCIVFSK